MASHPEHPELTRQFCFSTVFLRDFLRLSRAVDDTITQHLNALVMPSRAGFDPGSTATKTHYSPSSSISSFSSVSSTSSRAPPLSACRSFRDTVLFPAWQSREDVIRYCETVVQAQQEAADLEKGQQDQDQLDPLDPRDPRDPRLTERYDPYIRRRRFAEVEPETDRLAALLRQERSVESIVRARSWDVLRGRCGAGVAEVDEAGWEKALERWRRR